METYSTGAKAKPYMYLSALKTLRFALILAVQEWKRTLYISHVANFNLNQKIMHNCEKCLEDIKGKKKERKKVHLLGYLSCMDTNAHPVRSYVCAKLPNISLPWPNPPRKLRYPHFHPCYAHNSYHVAPFLSAHDTLLNRRWESLEHIMGPSMLKLCSITLKHFQIFSYDHVQNVATFST
jgi:hypothetical protein